MSGRQTLATNELVQHWEQLQREHDAFAEATHAQSREPDDRDETQSAHHPEIWVGSLGDYNSGYLHDVWLDATLDPEKLHQAVQSMLRNGHDSTAEEWSIMDYDDFCGLNFGEHESLEVVSRIARGIVELGEAFAKWAGYVGERSEEALARFADHYLGQLESTLLPLLG